MRLHERMVTTTTTAVSPTTTITNKSNMLLYTNNNNGETAAATNESEAVGGRGSGLTSCNTAATLEHYRLQLYNYALNMERLRGPPYTAAAAMAAAAAYASTTTVATATINGPTGHATNYTTNGQLAQPQPQSQAQLPASSYLCATTAGSIIAATSRMGRSPAALTQCPASNRFALTSMPLFPQSIFQPEEPKPQHSYIGLIAMAILSSAETKLVLSDIYQYILDNYPYFRTRGPGWRNSIRHNLSLNDCFIKSGRSANGKGHYWAIHPANMEDFRKGDFRRRKAQRKVRKHMGLAVDDNGADSPSPPPAMDLTPLSPPSFQHIVMGSSSITPMATAAQHLAAQSFRWRFTQHHHHHRQQSQHPQPAGTSYMGQVFTYRPHHYVAAAAAAAALCHNGNTQHHQQQLTAPCPPLHQHTVEASLMPPTSLLYTQSSLATTNVQTNVINKIFSQKRKRQFDVASLLAPDHLHKRDLHPQQQQYIRHHTSCDSETDEVGPSSPCNDNVIEANQSSNELDIEDIDVVEASEDEDVEADYDEHDDELDSNSNSQSQSQGQSRCHSASHSHNDDDEAEYIQSYNIEHRLRLKSTVNSHCQISQINVKEEEAVIRTNDYEREDDGEEEPNDQEGDDEHESTIEENEFECGAIQQHNNKYKNETHANNNNNNNSITPTFKATSSPLTTTSHRTQAHLIRVSSPLQSTSHMIISNQFIDHSQDLQHSETQQLPINTEAHNLLGRYYGTYMAAAAAARINSSMPSSVNTVVGNTD